MAQIHELVAYRLVDNDRLRQVAPAVVEDVCRLYNETQLASLRRAVDADDLESTEFNSCMECGGFFEQSMLTRFAESPHSRRRLNDAADLYRCASCIMKDPKTIRPALPTTSGKP